MPTLGTASLIEHFSDLPDPRADYNQQHKLPDILAAAICAEIARVESYTNTEPRTAVSSRPSCSVILSPRYLSYAGAARFGP